MNREKKITTILDYIFAKFLPLIFLIIIFCSAYNENISIELMMALCVPTVLIVVLFNFNKVSELKLPWIMVKNKETYYGEETPPEEIPFTPASELGVKK